MAMKKCVQNLLRHGGKLNFTKISMVITQLRNTWSHSPTNHINLEGQVRTFLQYGTKKRYFTVHAFTALMGCTWCVCSQENNLAPAVVVKIGGQEEDDVDDKDIDYFYFPGCCKCVNI
ncbi:uncharacterized protein LOC127847464 [Dreissena polymorpha]|uniref:uncharacterized protein LOC127847464 n=1 Tax=Dreissena polymorpha TaxID=45954 RepID=UPI0022649888|nr:uncharacterized protein LOC127847464 [Dreissena polymorpha]